MGKFSDFGAVGGTDKDSKTPTAPAAVSATHPAAAAAANHPAVAAAAASHPAVAAVIASHPDVIAAAPHIATAAAHTASSAGLTPHPASLTKAADHPAVKEAAKKHPAVAALIGTHPHVHPSVAREAREHGARSGWHWPSWLGGHRDFGDPNAHHDSERWDGAAYRGGWEGVLPWNWGRRPAAPGTYRPYRRGWFGRFTSWFYPETIVENVYDQDPGPQVAVYDPMNDAAYAAVDDAGDGNGQDDDAPSADDGTADSPTA